MPRFRRYRIFLAFAVFAVVVLYHFHGFHNLEDAESQLPAQHGSGGSKSEAGLQQDTKSPAIGAEPVQAVVQVPSTKISSPSVTGSRRTSTGPPSTGPPSARSTSSQIVPKATSSSSIPIPKEIYTSTDVTQATLASSTGAPQYVKTTDRPEAPSRSTYVAPIHWTRLPEHFPVPLESLIQLPTGKPSSLPRIQHIFKDESPTEKREREERLATIRNAFEHSWRGYKQHAWLHDELLPDSGEFRDPFCAWGATLVDALDTLHIMGFEEEFQGAVAALREIDFTTTPRLTIPLFETTIRYLGGLLSAYDLSGGKYQIILDKAVELGDILMGAFDTPNRMPIMYYSWKPTFMLSPSRAEYSVVLAEIGSLSVEFTRLAQITKEARYYDAVARITNEFERWQNQTRIPGLFPQSVDASGCKKPENGQSVPLRHDQPIGRPSLPDAKTSSATSAAPSKAAEDDGKIADPGGHVELHDGSGTLQKRQLAFEHDAESGTTKPVTDPTTQKAPAEQIPLSIKADCEPHGFDSAPGSFLESYTMAANADSMYEYLPKQHMLLGGRVPQYREMYEKAINAANKYLLFRPMAPKDADILVVGTAMVQEGPDAPANLKLKPEHTHLGCFVGGMWGIGSKLFDRKADLDIAARLTEACVWAYESTASGIMPESMDVIPCKEMGKCKWNQTQWMETLDPFRVNREKNQLIEQQQQQQAALEQEREAVEAPTQTSNSPSNDGSHLSKRQVGAAENNAQALKEEEEELGIDEEPAIRPSDQHIPTSTINKYPTHEEYVASRIENEGLPIGVPQLNSKKYILRPEAIESVFIMYRITGDPKWREKGWRMFKAIDQHTRAEYGHSALADVTKKKPVHLDQMESFWLAETLKYFYLLFSEPGVISLDEYVFNTEAHPFRRPA